MKIHIVHHLDPNLERGLFHAINALGVKIMSKISEFNAQMTAHLDRQDAAITDIQGDVKFLNDKITELQNSAGEISAEDQATLDALQQRGQATAEKLDALDALTPTAEPAPEPQPGEAQG